MSEVSQLTSTSAVPPDGRMPSTNCGLHDVNKSIEDFYMVYPLKEVLAVILRDTRRMQTAHQTAQSRFPVVDTHWL